LTFGIGWYIGTTVLLVCRSVAGVRKLVSSLEVVVPASQVCQYVLNCHCTTIC